MIILTKHCYNRVKERLHVKGNAVQLVVECAYRYGKDATDYRGDAAKYLAGKLKNNSNGVDTIRVYRGGIFLFANCACVTVLPLPEWFGKTIYVGKSRIRDGAKYYNYCLA